MKNLPKVTQHSGFELSIAVLQILAPEQWFSTRGEPVPQETFGLIWREFWLSHLGERGCYWHLWLQARDAVKHPTMHRTASTTDLSSPECQQY